jgi:hypothetical protein
LPGALNLKEPNYIILALDLNIAIILSFIQALGLDKKLLTTRQKPRALLDLSQ